jgi:hypothetical protein
MRMHLTFAFQSRGRSGLKVETKEFIAMENVTHSVERAEPESNRKTFATMACTTSVTFVTHLIVGRSRMW